MAQDMVRLLRALFLPGATACQEPGWCPPADVYRTATGWLVKLDLAGVRPEDVSVRLDGPRLTVRGSRRDWCLEEGCRHQQLEIAYSQFERSIDLPGPAPTQVATEYRHGMLLVHIRTEEAAP